MKGVQRRDLRDRVGPLEGGSVRTAYRAGLVLSLIGVLAALAVLVALVVGREDLASPATAITLFCASGGGAIVALTTERRAAD